MGFSRENMRHAHVCEFNNADVTLLMYTTYHKNGRIPFPQS